MRVNEIINERRKNAEENAIKYKNGVFNKFKEIETLFYEIRHLHCPMGKMLHLNNLAEYEKLELTQKYKINEMEELAKKYAVDLKKFQPSYTCKYCNDTGNIAGNPCKCYVDLLIEEKNNQTSKLGAKLGITFDYVKNHLICNDKEQKMQLEKNYEIAHRFVDAFPNSQIKIMILTGGVGTGKTTLTSCIVNALREKHSVYYIRAQELISALRSIYNNFDIEETQKSILDSADILIIDDLGTEPVTKNNEEYWFGLLDDRINNNKYTIINTNLNKEQFLQKYNERIYSRLTEKIKTYWMNFTGKDLRQVKNASIISTTTPPIIDRVAEYYNEH